MIVCECLGLTDKAVRQKLEKGASRLSDLVPKAALEGSCGTCFEALKKIIRQHQKVLAGSPAPATPHEELPALTI